MSFFASWCLPCNTEFEHLSLLHQSHAADGLTIVAVNLFGDVKRIPTVFVFDRQGRPRLHFVNAKNAKKANPGMDELRRAVRDARGIGAARNPPSLPESLVSVTKRSSSRKLSETRP